MSSSRVTANYILNFTEDSSNNLTMTPLPVSGSNVNAGTLNLTSGTSTGSGTSLITFQTAPVGSSGSSVNALAEVMRITSAGYVGIGNTSPGALLSVGANSGANGIINLYGSTSGIISIVPQAAAGTYNFNLPITAGSSGQVLTSAGGSSSAMSWTTLPTINSGTSGQVAYYSASSATISGESLGTLMNNALGSTQGQILYQNGTTWTVLAPGSSGQFLQTGGTGANPSWATAAGSGTVNSGTAGQVAYYNTSTNAVSGESLSALLDSSFGSTQGDILYRNSSVWTALPPGTSGQVLTTAGASANPSWTTGGTVLNSQTFVAGTNFTAGTTTTLTLSSPPPTAASLLVHVDGVYQNQSTYTLSGTTITFGSVIPLGTNKIECVWTATTATLASAVTVQDFAAGTGYTAGTSTTITLNATPPNAASLIISFDGITQFANTWSLAGAVVTFTSAIPFGVSNIEARWTAGAGGMIFGGTAASPGITTTNSNTTGIYSASANTVGIATNGVAAISVDASQNVTIANGLNGGQIAGFRNRIINGDMRIDQRNNGTAQTFTAAAALAYSVDRWYGYCTGANVTGQRVSGSGATQYRYQFTGAASVSAIGFAHRIEASNTYDLAGTTATLAIDISNSLLTTVTWTAYYANTTDAFGTLASPTKTQIATGAFTVSSTISRYSTQIAIPSAATTGIEILFTVAAQTSGTFVLGNVQLEAGTAATPFEHRMYGTELNLCQRYYEVGSFFHVGYGATPFNLGSTVKFTQLKRASPTITQTSTSNVNCSATTQNAGTGNALESFLSLRAGTATGGTQYAENWTVACEL